MSKNKNIEKKNKLDFAKFVIISAKLYLQNLFKMYYEKHF